MDSLQFVAHSPQRSCGVEHRFVLGLYVVRIRFGVHEASRCVAPQYGDGRRALRDDASALVVVRSGERGLARELHLERVRTNPPWALRLLRLLRHRDGRQGGRGLGLSLLRL